MIVEESDDVKRMWDIFMTEGTEGSGRSGRTSWDAFGAEDVQNAGFADSHSTGNRQRHGGSVVVRREETKRILEPEVLQGEDLGLRGQETFDTTLSVCGVPDTACRRTLVLNNR